MKLFDPKIKGHAARYVLQCLLAAAAVLVVLAVLGAIASAAVIAALGASSFIAFTMPETQASRPRFLIGGYLVGIAVGSLCHLLRQLTPATSELAESWITVLFGAFSVGLAIFGMVATNTEHPPAASLTLGLVLGELSLAIVAVVLIGIVMLCLIKRGLKPVLRNLL